MELSKEELVRYARHLSLEQVGEEGQQKIKQAKVLVIGAGGLGSPALLYLAAAGVGKLGIVDFDTIDESNLQRQVLYDSENIGKRKAEYAKKRILELNPNIEVEIYQEKLTKDNALEIIKEYDYVLDGSDNFPTRYLVNDACVILGKTNVYGSIYQFEGQVSVFNLKNGPCYRCLAPNPPPRDEIPNCSEAGVLGVLPGVIGAIQATEVLKIILGKGETLSGKLLTYNALNMEFQKLELKKNPYCKVCSENAEIKELQDYDLFCGETKEENNNQENDDITVQELKKIMDEKKEIVIIDLREPFEQEIGIIEGAKKFSFTKERFSDFKSFENLDKDKETIIYCHTGNRSRYTVDILKNKGFTKIKNLIGGIDSWSSEIDKSIERY